MPSANLFLAMDAELQMIVDSLSQRVERAVAIDDPRLHLLAYSTHENGEFDRARMASILAHAPPADTHKWVMSQGITKATGPMRLGPNRELAMDARVCVPVRANGVLLGFLWLTESEPPLDDEAIQIATQAADAAAAILYRHHFRSPGHREREVTLTHQLLSNDPEMRAAAAVSLADEGILRHDGPVVVMVARMREQPTSTVAGPLEAMIGQAMDQFRRSLAPHNCLAVPRGDHGVAIISGEEPALIISGLVDLTARVIGLLESTLTVDAESWVAGCSASPDDSSEAWRGYRQALDAALVAQTIPAFSPVADWSALGPYRYLAELAATPDARLPEPIEKVLALPADGGLAETLECYLDLAGDVKASASALSLHRASLYYRLEKIESLTERDLKRGEDRLELHLGLKLARLLKVHPSIAE